MALGCSVGLGPLVETRLSCARTLATQFGATRRIQAVQLPYRQGYDFVVQALVGQATKRQRAAIDLVQLNLVTTTMGQLLQEGLASGAWRGVPSSG